jgi:iron(III) transport system ATP-binding protein
VAAREIATLTRESGATVVYVTHDQSETFALADKIGVPEAGKLVQFDRFVARFTEVAADLPATVARVDGEFVVLESGGRRLRARAVGGLNAGDSTRPLPAATRIVPVG